MPNVSTGLRDVRSRLDSHLYDWAMRIPIVAYSIFVLTRDVLGFFEQALAQPGLFAEPDSGMIVATLARISQWMFVALLAILPIFRLRPIAKSPELLPRFVALVAVCLPPLFMLLERAPANLAFNSASVVLCLIANGMSAVTVSFLGRSLSVMPEARALVTDGPYAWVRHPLYLCEIAGVVAIVLQYRSLAAFGLFALVIALQVLRGRWEEAVLTRAFPEFRQYRARTPFIVPRDPVGFLATFVAEPAARRRSMLVAGTTAILLIVALTVLPRLSG